MNANHKEIDFELERRARVISKLEAENKELKLHNEKMRKAMASMGVSITKNEK